MKIKTIKSYTHTFEEPENEFLASHIIYDEKGNITEHTTYNNEGEIDSKTTCTFNEAGYKIEECNYFQNNEISDKTIFIRDNKMQLIREEVSFADGSVSIKKYENLPEQNTLILSFYDEDEILENKEITRYNNQNQILEKKNFNEENIITEHYINEIDEEGKLLQKKDFDEDEKLTSELQFFYDENKNLIKTLHLTPDRKLIDIHKYQYDEQNRLIEHQVGNYYVLKTEYNDQENSKTEQRINAVGVVETHLTTFYNTEKLVIKEEGIYTETRYEYEFY